MKFLFENPILLVALIGIISSLFKRLKGNSAEGGNQHTRGPFTQTTQPINSRPVERKRPVVRNTPLDEVLQEAKRMVEKTPNVQPIENRTAAKVVPTRNPATPIAPNNGTNKQSSHVINKTRLVDGVIWSEVLGPPRSRKPHTAIKPMNRVRN
jgi:hypothetical protein